MAEKEAYLDFRFTINRLPEGRALTADEIEQENLRKLEETGGTSKQALWNLAVIYSRTNRHDDACECVGKFAALTEDPEERASCWLAMGQLHEQLRNFDAAVRYYREAFAMKPEDKTIQYWINNNLGYSLIQIGRFKDAEPYLETAITIDQRRSNAFKNLGLALQHQGKNAEAADCFVLATQADASDSRSLKHLEALIAKHPEVLLTATDLAGKLDVCRKAVEHAASRQPDFDAYWERMREQQRKTS